MRSPTLQCPTVLQKLCTICFKRLACMHVYGCYTCLSVMYLFEFVRAVNLSVWKLVFVRIYARVRAVCYFCVALAYLFKCCLLLCFALLGNNNGSATQYRYLHHSFDGQGFVSTRKPFWDALPLLGNDNWKKETAVFWLLSTAEITFKISGTLDCVSATLFACLAFPAHSSNTTQSQTTNSTQ